MEWFYLLNYLARVDFKKHVIVRHAFLFLSKEFMNFKKIFLFLSLGFCISSQAQSLPDKTLGISDLYLLAKHDFETNRLDDGVAAFYAGQLRLRIIAKLDNDPSNTPALLGALQEEMGPTINGYAGGDVNQWSKDIHVAMDWHKSHSFPELQEMLTRTHKTHEDGQVAEQKIMDGLNKFLDKMMVEKQSFYEQRVKNGLPVRDPDFSVQQKK